LAIIIDDIGYNLALGRRAAELTGAYTLAVLPMTPHSRKLAALARAQGKELMLHAPMANSRHLPLGPGGLEADMPRARLLLALRQSLDSLPEVVGVNNHMGSALTAQARPMGWVMGELSKRSLYFVDSRTTAATVARQVAQAYGLKTAQRDVFLDHSRDPAHIEQQLIQALMLARERGSAIAIGHPYPETLAVLERAQEHLAHYAVQLVSASALVKTAPRSRQYCPLAPVMLRRPARSAVITGPLMGQQAWWYWHALITK
jgi:polysaccharide deacetylase 2 family uncharacterized protein YibQ